LAQSFYHTNFQPIFVLIFSYLFDCLLVCMRANLEEHLRD
jgi:hypothetical protein